MIEFSPGLFRGPRVDSLPEGIKTVIDLQYDPIDVSWESTDFVPHFYWIATIALLPPDKTRVEVVMSLFCEAKSSLRPIYLHCKSGVDRTGYMVAKYRRIYQGWSRWRAFKEMVEMGMHPWFYWWGFFL